MIVCPICTGAGVVHAGSGSAISLTAVTLAGNPFREGAAVQVSFGSVSFLDTILENTGDAINQGNCANLGGTIVSLDHNFSNDNDPDCNLSQASDISSSGEQLSPLANNGGPTLTRMPLPGSLLISHGQCLPAVPVDQRGAAAGWGVRYWRGGVCLTPGSAADKAMSQPEMRRAGRRR